MTATVTRGGNNEFLTVTVQGLLSGDGTVVGYGGESPYQLLQAQLTINSGMASYQYYNIYCGSAIVLTYNYYAGYNQQLTLYFPVPPTFRAGERITFTNDAGAGVASSALVLVRFLDLNAGRVPEPNNEPAPGGNYG